jgi:lipoate-protein ligase B
MAGSIRSTRTTTRNVPKNLVNKAFAFCDSGPQPSPALRERGPNQEAKIAALGLKVRNGHTYHGLAFNVNMDLTPFSAINPCGYEGLRVTHLHELGVDLSLQAAGMSLAEELRRQLTAPAK